MNMNTKYLPTVVVQVVMKKVSWREVYMYSRSTCKCRYNEHEHKILTDCGCAGSDEKGVMERGIHVQ